MSAMDPNFAVFNGHKNDADKRARAALRRMGATKWLQEVENVERDGNGIMNIFNVPISPATAAYAALAAHFVNGEEDAG